MFNNYLYGKEILLERKEKSYRKNNDYSSKPFGDDKSNNELDEYIAKNWRPKNPDDREDLEQIREKK